MNKITVIEKSLASKRRSLLYCLRENNWDVIEINDDYADWAYDEKWVIESTRENKGFTLQLWFFKCEGIHDGMDRVVATLVNEEQPNAYSGEPSIDFDGRKFEPQLSSFMNSIQNFRLSKVN